MAAAKGKKAKQGSKASKIDVVPRSVFVIMPFTKTLTRNAAQLAAFYEDHLKRPIEAEAFLSSHLVRRSDESFNITEQIIKDLYVADVVICDLSGEHANPNVMYELGIRLAVSNKPVVLIREAHSKNHPIFDIGGFYAEQYDPFNYAKITGHVLTKLHRFETGAEQYASPVLKILKMEEPLLQTISKQRAAYLLSVMALSLTGAARLFSGAVVQYLGPLVSIDLGQKADDLLHILQEHFDEVDKLDWSGLKYGVGTQPAIDAYLSSLYLLDLVEKDVEARFTEAVLDYHAYFLSGDRWFAKPSPMLTIFYLGESLVLARLARVVAAYLMASPSDRPKLLELFDAYFAERHVQ